MLRICVAVAIGAIICGVIVAVLDHRPSISVMMAAAVSLVAIVGLSLDRWSEASPSDPSAMSSMIGNLGNLGELGELGATGLSQLVFQSMAEGLIVTDADGRPLITNPAAERIFGTVLRDHLAPEWPNRAGVCGHDGVTPCASSEFPLVRAMRGESVRDVELFIQNEHVPAGAWISGSAQPLRDKQDTVYGGLMVFREVTTRKRVEWMLQRERERLKRHHERQASLNGITLTITEASELSLLFHRIVNLAQDHLPGTTAQIVLCDPTTEALLRDTAPPEPVLPAAALCESGPARWIVEHQRILTVADIEDDPFDTKAMFRDGGALAYAGFPLRAEQGIGGVLFMMSEQPRHFEQDELEYMTALADRLEAAIARVGMYERLKSLNAKLAEHRERLELEVRERTAELETSHRRLRSADRLASIGTFTAGLGHDMNNVLFPVRCRLDVLDWERVPENLTGLLRAVSDAIEYLQQLTDGLRLFALDPDVADASAELTSITDWWQQVSPLLAQSVRGQVTLEHEFADDLPRIRIAPHRLTQAMLNLVVNASEAMPDGGHVTVWARPTDDQRAIRLGVTDEGHGMDADVQLHACDPFFTTKTRQMSTGLGLSLVHGVVSAARGRLDVDSTPGVGTTFVMEFPTADEPNALAAVPRAVQGVAAVTLTNARVAAWVTSMLRSAGYDVVQTKEVSERAALWIVEAKAEHEDAARQYVRGDSDRRVIAFGPGNATWTAMGAIMIENEAQLDTIRTAIGAVSIPAPRGMT